MNVLVLFTTLISDGLSKLVPWKLFYNTDEKRLYIGTGGENEALPKIIDIPVKVSDLSNDTGFITTSALPTKVSQLTNDTGFITALALPTRVSQLSNDYGFITASALPTKVSQLTNDTGFITTSALPTKVSQLTNDSGFIKSTDTKTMDGGTF